MPPPPALREIAAVHEQRRCALREIGDESLDDRRLDVVEVNVGDVRNRAH
jgi:hypothetical protein